jgi:hypothetical protein
MPAKRTMSVNVLTQVYKDQFSVYASPGCPMAVSSDSMVFQVEKVELIDSPLLCNTTPHPYLNLLKIVDPQYGIMWIDETAQSFADKIGQASSGTASTTRSITVTIGDPGMPVAGMVIIVPELVNAAAVLDVELDSTVAQNIPFTASTGALDFTGIGGVGNGSVLTVLYNF